jgi:hypothetical protein
MHPQAVGRVRSVFAAAKPDGPSVQGGPAQISVSITSRCLTSLTTSNCASGTAPRRPSKAGHVTCCATGSKAWLHDRQGRAVGWSAFPRVSRGDGTDDRVTHVDQDTPGGGGNARDHVRPSLAVTSPVPHHELLALLGRCGQCQNRQTGSSASSPSTSSKRRLGRRAGSAPTGPCGGAGTGSAVLWSRHNAAARLAAATTRDPRAPRHGGRARRC